MSEWHEAWARLGEVVALHELAVAIWGSTWGAVELFEDDPAIFSYRCTLHGGRKLFIETGEDLPGSWHQQRNGGSRFWTAVRGEFDAVR
jgi:hypothetical protein